MLKKLLILYRMSMAHDVRSPMPHLVGPPGCGKSTNVEQLADLLGVGLHVINVSRISPLEVEGVQMPHGEGDDMMLRMLPATFWTSIREGDIVFFDEFLRGFPEVYNSLLDIFTGRRAGAFTIPPAFFMGASNNIATYDPALKDRLLHIPVTDPRKYKTEQARLKRLFVDQAGLLPALADTIEMDQLFTDVVLPLFDMLDTYTGSGKKVVAEPDGLSIRNLIGQVKMRMPTEPKLRSLLELNNRMAMAASQPQFVVLLGGGNKYVPQGYDLAALQLRKNPKLTEIQRINLDLNLELIELNEAEEGQS